MDRKGITTAMSDFKAVTVVHTHQDQARERIEFLADFGSNTSLIILAGPTGAGKSALLAVFIRGYIKRCASALAEDPSLIPLIYSIATASGHRLFDWQQLFVDALADLHDPFAMQRLNKKGGQPETEQRLLDGSRSASLLRTHFQHESKLRGLRIWVIDEAHHLVRGGRSGTPGDQLDVLKSISQKMGITIILSGTYDLPDFIANSGQLSRRSEVVCIHRYDWNDDVQRNQFASVVNKLLLEIPLLDERPDVSQLETAKFFYVCSIGCIGICKDWIARAFALMLQDGKNSLTLDYFQKTRLSDAQLRTLIREVRRGEARIARKPAGEPVIGLSEEILRPETPASKPEKTDKPKTGDKPEKSAKSKQARSPTPGTRKATRSPVGGANGSTGMGAA